MPSPLWCSYCLFPSQLLLTFPKTLGCCHARWETAPWQSAWKRHEFKHLLLLLLLTMLAEGAAVCFHNHGPSCVLEGRKGLRPEMPLAPQAAGRTQVSVLTSSIGKMKIRILVMAEGLWLFVEVQHLHTNACLVCAIALCEAGWSLCHITILTSEFLF